MPPKPTHNRSSPPLGLPTSVGSVPPRSGTTRPSRSTTPDGQHRRGISPNVHRAPRGTITSRDAIPVPTRDSNASEVINANTPFSGNSAGSEATADRHERQKQMISQYKEFLALRRSSRLSQASVAAVENTTSGPISTMPFHHPTLFQGTSIATEPSSQHHSEDEHTPPKQNWSSASGIQRWEIAPSVPHPDGSEIEQWEMSPGAPMDTAPLSSAVATPPEDSTAADVSSAVPTPITPVPGRSRETERPSPASQEAATEDSCSSDAPEAASPTTLQFHDSETGPALSSASPAEPPSTQRPPTAGVNSPALSERSSMPPSPSSSVHVHTATVSCLRVLEGSDITVHQLEELRDKRHIPPIPPIPPVAPVDSISSPPLVDSPLCQPIQAVSDKGADAVSASHLEALEIFTRDIIRQTVEQLSSETSRIDQRWRTVSMEAWARKYDQLLNRLENVELRIAQLQPGWG
eukprot:GGOE01020485.1.p1 GENE.GGOE01020485.1~~GGOE01020485.1.p1  ORF type:complete len:464 (+),score=40.54 GGOE01020485.1:48-1439(+)